MSTRRKLLKSLALAPLALGSVRAWANTTTSLPARDDPDFWEKVRDQYLLAKDKVFFNPGTVGAMPRIVVERVNEHMIKLATDVAEWEYRGDKGWISGYYHMPEIREKIAQLIHADAASIALTDNVTSAMSYIAEGLTLKAGDEIITSNQEHGGGRSSWIVREKRDGIRYREFTLGKPIRNEQEVFDTVVSAFRSETRVLVLSHMITGSGALLPVKEICAEARKRGILTVLDGAQIIGQVSLNIQDIGCDAYVGCFHKWIGAPPGTGFMWVKPEILKNLWTSVSSYQWNNHEDEGFRFTQRGTGNYSILLGLEAALDFHAEIGAQRVYDRIKYLGNYLRDELRKMPKVKVFSPAAESMCAGISVYNVMGVTGSKLQDAFWNEARMRPRSQGDEFGVRHCTHIFNSEKEIEAACRIVRKVAGS
jgi:selenocysteine lyase/cysteine desulfurase